MIKIVFFIFLYTTLVNSTLAFCPLAFNFCKPAETTWLDVFHYAKAPVIDKLKQIFGGSFIVRNFDTIVYSIVGLQMTILLAFVIIYIKGRPDRRINANTNANATTVRTKITNIMATDCDDQGFNRSRNHIRTNIPCPTNLAKAPTEFNGKCDIFSWFNKLESFLEAQAPYNLWLNIAITYVHDSCLLGIPIDELKLRDEGYVMFKKALIAKYASFSENKKTLDDLINRTQKADESVTTYGRALAAIAKSVFDCESDKTEEILKDQIIKGLYNNELKALAAEQKYLTRDKQYPYADLIEFLAGKEIGLIERKKASSQESTSTVDTESDNRRYSIRYNQVYNPHNNNQRPYSPNRQNQGQQFQHSNQTQNHYYNPNNTQHKNATPNNNPNQYAVTQNISPNIAAKNIQSGKSASNDDKKAYGINVVNSMVKNGSIRGICLFDKIPVSYLCDPGAAKTIISEKTFNNLLNKNPKIKLNNYFGRGLRSANQKLNILGVLKVKELTMSETTQLPKMLAIVVADVEEDCLLGRNWIKQIPELRSLLDNLSIQVREMTAGVTSLNCEAPAEASDDDFEYDLEGESQSEELLCEIPDIGKINAIGIEPNARQSDEGAGIPNPTTS